jgi:hypothetical protein
VRLIKDEEFSAVAHRFQVADAETKRESNPPAAQAKPRTITATGYELVLLKVESSAERRVVSVAVS